MFIIKFQILNPKHIDNHINRRMLIMFNVFLANASIMDSSGIFAVVVFAIIIFAGIFAWIKSKSKTVSSDELIEYFLTKGKEKIVSFITEEAFKEELKSESYAEFVKACINNFSEKLYNYISENKNEFNIPAQLEPFFTLDTIKTVTQRVCQLEEVNKILGQVYDDHWKKRFEEIKNLEEEEVAKNAEYGDDGTDKELHPAKFVEDSEPVQIGAPSVDEKELEEVVSEKEVANEEEIKEEEKKILSPSEVEAQVAAEAPKKKTTRKRTTSTSTKKKAVTKKSSTEETATTEENKAE